MKMAQWSASDFHNFEFINHGEKHFKIFFPKLLIELDMSFSLLFW